MIVDIKAWKAGNNGIVSVWKPAVVPLVINNPYKCIDSFTPNPRKSPSSCPSSELAPNQYHHICSHTH